MAMRRCAKRRRNNLGLLSLCTHKRYTSILKAVPNRLQKFLLALCLSHGEYDQTRRGAHRAKKKNSQ